MDSVVLVPVAMLAEPVILPVDSSRKAQPKKLVLTGGWMAAGSAGAASLGSGGAGWAAMLAVSLAGVGSSRLPRCPCAPRAASFPRAAGTSIRLSTTAATREATRATRRRIRGTAPTGTGGSLVVSGRSEEHTSELQSH